MLHRCFALRIERRRRLLRRKRTTALAISQIELLQTARKCCPFEMLLFGTLGTACCSGIAVVTGIEVAARHHRIVVIFVRICCHNNCIFVVRVTHHLCLTGRLRTRGCGCRRCRLSRSVGCVAGRACHFFQGLGLALGLGLGRQRLANEEIIFVVHLLADVWRKRWETSVWRCWFAAERWIKTDADGRMYGAVCEAKIDANAIRMREARDRMMPSTKDKVRGKRKEVELSLCCESAIQGSALPDRTTQRVCSASLARPGVKLSAFSRCCPAITIGRQSSARAFLPCAKSDTSEAKVTHSPQRYASFLASPTVTISPSSRHLCSIIIVTYTPHIFAQKHTVL